MQDIMNSLFSFKPITREDSQILFNSIIRGELTEAQLAAVLISMKMRGEQPEEIVGAVLACLENAQPFPTPEYIFSDIVGTGGDGANSINISTAGAFVGAACGLKIAKHGNRSVSSKSGSSDVLSALGVSLTLGAKEARECLDEANLCFLFAPQYHSGFKHAAPVRSQLKTRTLFNILGPLINPARPPIALIGVYDKGLLKPVAETLKLLNYKRCAVVHSQGLDEVSLHSTTDVAELKDGEICYYELTADDFCLPVYSLASLEGGDPKKNSEYLLDLLQGKGKKEHINAVAANVALLLRLHGQEDLKINVLQVIDVINSGKAYNVLEKLINKSIYGK